MKTFSKIILAIMVLLSGLAISCSSKKQPSAEEQHVIDMFRAAGFNVVDGDSVKDANVTMNLPSKEDAEKVLDEWIKNTDSIRKSHEIITFIVPDTIPMSFSGDDAYGAYLFEYKGIKVHIHAPGNISNSDSISKKDITVVATDSSLPIKNSKSKFDVSLSCSDGHNNLQIIKSTNAVYSFMGTTLFQESTVGLYSFILDFPGRKVIATEYYDLK